MQIRYFTNNATTSLVSDNNTTIQVTSTLLFPTSYPFYITVENLALTKEIIRVNSLVSAGVWNVTRAQEGFTQISFSAGDKVELRLTAGTLNGLVTDKAELSGAAFTGNVSVKNTGSNGWVQLISGDATHTGYVDFRDPSGNRMGYIGYGSGNQIDIFADSTKYFMFSGGSLEAPRSQYNATTSDGLVRKAQLDAKITGRINVIRVFSSVGSSSFTPIAGTNNLIVEVQGAGGGGGASLGGNGVNGVGLGGGGGGGGYTIGYMTSSDIATAISAGGGSIPIVIGAGGSAGVVGTNYGNGAGFGGNGGTSSLGSLFTATGGIGGGFIGGLTNANAVSGVGPGGAGGGGIISINGDSGSHGFGGGPLNLGVGGNGGKSHLGSGGRGIATYYMNSTIFFNGGSAGGRYGGGGGGGAIFSNNNATSNNGYAGADGVIVVYEYA